MCPKSDSWYSYIQKLQTRKLMENQYIVNGLCKVFQKVEYIIRFDFFHQKIKPTHATRTYFFQMQLKLCTFSTANWCSIDHVFSDYNGKGDIQLARQ